MLLLLFILLYYVLLLCTIMMKMEIFVSQKSSGCGQKIIPSRILQIFKQPLVIF